MNREFQEMFSKDIDGTNNKPNMDLCGTTAFAKSLLFVIKNIICDTMQY